MKARRSSTAGRHADEDDGLIMLADVGIAGPREGDERLRACRPVS
jgi:hypothetical protein